MDQQLYTDADVDKMLRHLLGDVDALLEHWSNGRLTPQVGQGSSLAGDDRKTDPYQLSHSITHLTAVAVEQLHAVKVLVVDNGLLHNSAPFTLARSSIEVAATALWMLAPTDRPTRVKRRLRVAKQDAQDGSAMAKGAGVPEPRDLDQRIADMETLASDAFGELTTLPWVSMIKLIEQVDALKPSPLGIVNTWRAASGFAHGRSWAALGYLEKEVISTGQSGVTQLRLTNRLDNVLWVTWAGYDLIKATLRLFQKRAQPLYG